jgi:hypothetical protein
MPRPASRDTIATARRGGLPLNVRFNGDPGVGKLKCLLVAPSGHLDCAEGCPLLEVKGTSAGCCEIGHFGEHKPAFHREWARSQ